MGLLVNGQWHDKWYDTKASGGEFVREDAQLRHWITADGSAGESGKGGFVAEKNRYHLYISYACPWAHRTLIFRQLKGLEDYITVSAVHPYMLENGWTFEKDEHGANGDDLFDNDFMHQIYTKNKSDYTGRVTVPVLWDKQQQCIVSNESSEIIRMFNSAFNHLTGNTDDYYPENLRKEINTINDMIYNNINNGVYRCGFATTQIAYEKAFEHLFGALEEVEKILSQHRYLVGETLTEADWRLFTTLVRFDAVYVGHFKCNLKRIADYPNISAYLRELYQYRGVKETVNMHHIKAHYYYSHETINPTRVIPKGPALDLDLPHNRG